MNERGGSGSMAIAWAGLDATWLAVELLLLVGIAAAAWVVYDTYDRST